MICLIGKHAETEPSVTTDTLKRGGLTLILKRVPARVYPNRVEAYVSDAIASRLLDGAEALTKAGAVINVRKYAGA